MSVGEAGWLYYTDLSLNSGLSVAEADEMTPGMIIDLAIQRMNQQGSEESQTAGRAARQADYDAF